MTAALDIQIGGSHYTDMAIQPMEFSMANKLDACQHTIIKYVSRFRTKGGIQDLEKAKHVIDMLIEFEQADLVPGPDLGDPADEPNMKADECQCPVCKIGRTQEREFQAELDRITQLAQSLADAEPASPAKPSDDEIRTALNVLISAGVVTHG